PGPDVGTGTAYRHHVPLTTHIKVNDCEGKPLSSLLDTGASLSIIDRNLLETLGGSVKGGPMPVHGLGDATTLGWSTITFFVDARDQSGRAVQMECVLDFHVLEAFGPGLCLGQDFINTHGVVINSRAGTAAVTGDGGSLTFTVREHMPTPYAKEAVLCVSADTVVPARSHAWVAVDVSSLAPALDYTVYPRLSVTEDESVRLAGPVALLNASTKHILLTNVGTSDAVLERRTPVADALAAQAGDFHLQTAEHFTLGAEPPAAQLHTSAPPTTAAAHTEVDLTPLSLYDDGDACPEAPPDTSTVPANALVDDAFKVGVNSSNATASAFQCGCTPAAEFGG
ncbi:hypothetical protein OC844_008040, partial [Tilletia horrida]